MIKLNKIVMVGPETIYFPYDKRKFRNTKRLQEYVCIKEVTAKRRDT